MKENEIKPINDVEQNRLSDKAKNNVLEALKVLEKEKPRLDGAIYYLLGTNNKELIEIAGKLFKYEILRQIRTLRNNTDLSTLLHTPKHVAVSFIRYVLDKESSLYNQELDSTLDQETKEIGIDLVHLLIVMEEFSGWFELSDEESEFNNRIIGSEQYNLIRNKSQEKKPADKKGKDIENHPEIKEMVNRIIQKYSILNIPTEDEINSYIREQLPKIKRIVEEN